MSQYIIISWNMPSDAAIVTDNNGENMVFSNRNEAKMYAEEACAWNWKLIEV